MFFCFSVRNKKKERKSKGGLLIILVFFLLIALCMGAFAYTRLFAPHSETEVPEFGRVNLSADTETQREKFFEQFGVKAQSVHQREVVIPESGEGFESYLEMQKSQGFDLAPFMGERATQYVLKLSEKTEEGYPLYGVLTILGGKVISAHLTDYVYPSRCLPLEYLSDK